MKAASARFAAALNEPHTLATEVDVLVDGEVAHTITETVTGTVTLDATAQTRGRLDITFAPDDQGLLLPTDPDSLLAPYGNELHVKRGIQYPGGDRELVGLGVYRIDSAEPQDTAEGLTIPVAARDRSARLIDARFEEPYQIDQGDNYADAILEMLQAAWPDMPYEFATTSHTTPALFFEEQGDRWAAAQEMATAIACRLYFDGDGVCRLDPAASSATPTVELVEGDGGVLLQAARRWHREGTYNRVIATGEATSEEAPARGVATDDNPLSPTYYFGPFGKVPRFYASPFITTDAQAQDAAHAILARELGTTQQIQFGAIVDPRLEPDDVAQITRQRLGIDEVHVLDQVTIPLAADQAATGRTRAVVIQS